jgi:hypothetical protein
VNNNAFISNHITLVVFFTRMVFPRFCIALHTLVLAVEIIVIEIAALRHVQRAIVIVEARGVAVANLVRAVPQGRIAVLHRRHPITGIRVGVAIALLRIGSLKNT